VCARPTPLRIPGLLLARPCAGPRRRHSHSSSHALHHDPDSSRPSAPARAGATAAPLDKPDLMGVRGHDPAGSDRLLIKPAAMVTRPVPAARGHFAAKAHPRRPVTSGPPALQRQPPTRWRHPSASVSERPIPIRATLPTGTTPVRSPSGHRGSITVPIRSVRCLPCPARTAVTFRPPRRPLPRHQRYSSRRKG
jgi:hypothetical protein